MDGILEKIKALPTLPDKYLDRALQIWENLDQGEYYDENSRMRINIQSLAMFNLKVDTDQSLSPREKKEIKEYMQKLIELVDEIVAFKNAAQKQWIQKTSNINPTQEQVLPYWALILRDPSTQGTPIEVGLKTYLAKCADLLPILGKSESFGEAANTVVSLTSAMELASDKKITKENLLSGNQNLDVPSANLNEKQFTLIMDDLKNQIALERENIQAKRLEMVSKSMNRAVTNIIEANLSDGLILAARSRNPFQLSARKNAKSELNYLLQMMNQLDPADKVDLYKKHGDLLYKAEQIVKQKDAQTQIGFFERPRISKTGRENYKLFKEYKRAVKALTLLDKFGTDFTDKPAIQKGFMKILYKIKDEKVLNDILAQLDQDKHEGLLTSDYVSRKNKMLASVAGKANWKGPETKPLSIVLKEYTEKRDLYRGYVKDPKSMYTFRK